MKPIYEVLTNELSLEMVKRTDPDGKIWWIPTDPANSDYQKYLEFLNETSTK